MPNGTAIELLNAGSAMLANRRYVYIPILPIKKCLFFNSLVNILLTIAKCVRM